MVLIVALGVLASALYMRRLERRREEEIKLAKAGS